MAAQLDERKRLIDAGEQPLGWKVGFGSPQAKRELKIHQSLVGYLMRSAVVESGIRYSLSDFTKIALEPEIAVYLGAAVDAGSDADTIKAAISGLGPAIEIADVTFPFADGAEKILANNIYHRGVVLGAVDEGRAGAELAGLAATINVNGTDIDVPDDLQANTGPIVELVALVADTLAVMGERLNAGELIILGSIVPPIFAEAATSLTYTLGDAEPISVNVA